MRSQVFTILSNGLGPERPWEGLKKLASLGLVALAVAMAPTAHAQVAQADTGAGPVLSLSAQASTEVQQDQVTATYVMELQGDKPGPIQAQVNKVLAAVLAELKSDARLQVSSGSYNTYPHNDRDGKVVGWRVRAELRAQSADFEAVSQASDKVTERMPLSSLYFSLSTPARERVERELMKEAADRFHEKARDAAKALGFQDIELLEVEYNHAGTATPMPRGVRAARMEAASLPIEPGHMQVRVSFGGSVRLKR